MRGIKLIPGYALVLTVLLSCQTNEGKFRISNKSDYDIDSLQISPDANHQLIHLKKDETVAFNTNMDEISTDGAYSIAFKSAHNQQVLRRFGYYTNGHQLEEVINITILNDTILINGKFDNLY
ncbi:hypothetical protein [Winogradskyella sediminis]|uniref:hypothetical protein n=1 Tax=Winogradskyella sediminis TaxID=1382466 RepID=UPI003AA805AA